VRIEGDLGLTDEAPAMVSLTDEGHAEVMRQDASDGVAGCDRSDSAA
jgi:hypothetical protein